MIGKIREMAFTPETVKEILIKLAGRLADLEERMDRHAGLEGRMDRHAEAHLGANGRFTRRISEIEARVAELELDTRTLRKARQYEKLTEEAWSKVTGEPEPIDIIHNPPVE